MENKTEIRTPQGTIIEELKRKGYVEVDEKYTWGLRVVPDLSKRQAKVLYTKVHPLVGKYNGVLFGNTVLPKCEQLFEDSYRIAQDDPDPRRLQEFFQWAGTYLSVLSAR